MTNELLSSLSSCETDLSGVMRRFSGDEAFYLSCLKAFLKDETINELDNAIREQSWDEAFTAAHALKGLAGNLGFVPLFHATGELVMLIRNGRIKDVYLSNDQVRRCYNDVVSAIRHIQ